MSAAQTILVIIAIIVIIAVVILIWYPQIFNNAADLCQQLVTNATKDPKTANLCVKTDASGG